ncbi:MAG: hypothetical protein IPO67_05350 [Deltaproteobacteria bacterium]|nr:hypothetical protein [Deltaproteobacteria bacterium]
MSRLTSSFLLLAAVGCGPGEVVILSPVDGEALCGDPMVLQLDVSGFRLVAPTGDETHREGRGHLDVVLNGQDAAMIWEEQANIGVEAGVWRLRVELSYDDHSPTGAFDELDITVDPTLCP